MRRPSQIAVIAVFVIVFGAPLVLFLLGVRPEFDENRARAKFPSLQPRAMVDEDLYAQIEAAYTDRLPLRDRGISFYTDMVEWASFADAVRVGLPRGADGWLYYADDLVEECAGPPPDVFLERAGAVAEASEAAGIPFYYVVAPDKVSVYPDHLPKTEGLAGVLGLSATDLAQCTTTWREALADAAPERPWLVPLLESVRSRSGDADEPTYFKLDTHWTDYGALSQVMETVERIQPGLWNPDEVVRVQDVSKVGDLTRLLGRPEEETVPGYAIRRPGVEAAPVRQSQGDVTDNLDLIVTRATGTGAPLIEGTTIFIADSFGRRSLQLMAPYFEELVFVSREYLIRHPMSEIVDSRPDRIIIEQVQRNLAKEWYTQGLDATVDATQLPA